MQAETRPVSRSLLSDGTVPGRRQQGAPDQEGRSAAKALRLQLHQTIQKVTADGATLRHNTAISALMILLNALEERADAVSPSDVSVFLRLLAPFAPHITEELWREARGETSSIHRAPWPEADPRHLRAERVTVVVQVNGRVRDRIEGAPDATEEAVRQTALARPRISGELAGRRPKRFIYVPGKIVNIAF